MIVTLIVIGAIYVGCIALVLARARESARIVSNARTLQSLCMVMQMYADMPDNQNCFPDAGSPAASLALLYPHYVADFGIFISVRDPEQSSKLAHARKAIAEGRPLTECYDDIGIGYETGVTPIDPMAILLYEKSPVNGGRNVCNVGGSVEYMNERDFQRVIKKQREAIDAQRVISSHLSATR